MLQHLRGKAEVASHERRESSPPALGPNQPGHEKHPAAGSSGHGAGSPRRGAAGATADNSVVRTPEALISCYYGRPDPPPRRRRRSRSGCTTLSCFSRVHPADTKYECSIYIKYDLIPGSLVRGARAARNQGLERLHGIVYYAAKEGPESRAPQSAAALLLFRMGDSPPCTKSSCLLKRSGIMMICYRL